MQEREKNDVLSTLGLCLRAGKMVLGSEAVTDFLKNHHAKLILIAQDAGENLKRKAAFYAGKAAIKTVPWTKVEMGSAFGRKTCSICCVSDAGFAALIGKNLEGESKDRKKE